MDNYIPVLDMGQALRRYDGKKNVSLSWWTDDALFQYKTLLISAYYGMSKWNFREHCNIPDDVVVFGDSGGFQNSTRGATLNPLNVLKWQEKNCDIGFIFDEPIGPKDDQETIILKQTRTTKNAQMMVDARDPNSKLKLYAVLHGHTEKDLLRMKNMYGDLSQYDGIAIGSMVPIAGNMTKVTDVILNVINMTKHLNVPYHIFGISGIDMVPFLMKLLDKYTVTFDSSTYLAGYRRAEYWNPYDMKQDVSFAKISPTPIETLPCSCPVCKNMQSLQTLHNGGGLAGALISLHNMYVYVDFVRMLKSLVKDDKAFKRFIALRSKPLATEVILKLEKFLETNRFLSTKPEEIVKEGTFTKEEIVEIVKDAQENKSTIFDF